MDDDGALGDGTTTIADFCHLHGVELLGDGLLQLSKASLSAAALFEETTGLTCEQGLNLLRLRDCFAFLIFFGTVLVLLPLPRYRCWQRAHLLLETKAPAWMIEHQWTIGVVPVMLWVSTCSSLMLSLVRPFRTLRISPGALADHFDTDARSEQLIFALPTLAQTPMLYFDDASTSRGGEFNLTSIMLGTLALPALVYIFYLPVYLIAALDHVVVRSANHGHCKQCCIQDLGRVVHT